MSKDSGSMGKRGLLSKVVKFVSSPTTHWADLDRPENHSEISDSRLALKEMVERKRRNDFVRNREFDLLRKARRREASGEDEAGSSFSFPPSSQMASTGGRARTLEKIDEIEKQMSSAWLKRKSEAVGAQVAAAKSLHAELAGASQSASSERPEDDDFPPTISIDTSTAAEADEGTRPTAQSQTPADAQVVFPSSPPGNPTSDSPGESPSTHSPGSLSSPDSKQDPEIEEAAIRFANGDTAGAEAGLLKLMDASDPRSQQLDTWLTLFDYYRATREQGKFDDAAIDFAGRFGRSAPQWVLGPPQSSLVMGLPVTEPAALDPQAAAHAQWVSPSSLGVQSVAALNATLARHSPPWQIDWRYIKSIEASALPVLTEALQQWADTPVRINFVGSDRLMQLLKDCSPTDDRSVDPMWWTARLALLRVQGEMDEFELVALKYCVTYEVSPPAWQDPVNGFSDVTTERGALAAEDGGSLESRSASLAPLAHQATALPIDDGAVNTQGVLKLDLTGELLGDASYILDGLAASGASTIEFHCSQLSRVDFGAAGTLLNWAVAQQSSGVRIVFKHVNRLVAAFFGVVGVTEVAQVRLRKD